MSKKWTCNGVEIEVVKGDITKEQVDAVVNAANESLRGGGGVDGAIHRAGGPAILEECRTLDHCDVGDAKITTAGEMPAEHVIHTVGPVYHNGKKGEPELLDNCYRRSLEVAVENGCKTIAFPAVSCGVYRFPADKAARIAIAAAADWAKNPQGIELMRFVLFSDDIYEVFENALEEQQRASE